MTLFHSTPKDGSYDIVAFVTRALAVMESAVIEAETVERLQETVRDALKDWHDALEMLMTTVASTTSTPYGSPQSVCVIARSC